MKTKILASLIVIIACNTSWAKPGGSYVLTGTEKNIEAIIKADMEKTPDLYKGENFKFYAVKFKQLNKIGKRKLAPGDELFFPETKASIEAKKHRQKQLIIGKWKHEKKDNVQVSIITEYKSDGTFTLGMVAKPTYSGTWEIRGEYLHLTIKKNHFRKLFAEEKKPTKQKIISVSTNELKTKTKNNTINIATKINYAQPG